MPGCEWVIEAHACDPASLSDLPKLRGLFATIVEGLSLHPLGKGCWHQFPGGGITGLTMLAESHITCHTFPEYGSLCLNVFCCRPRPDLDFETRLRHEFGASSVQVRRLERPYQT